MAGVHGQLAGSPACGFDVSLGCLNPELSGPAPET